MTKLFLPLSVFILACTHSLAEAPNKTQSDDSTELANAVANTAAIINSIPDIIFYKDIDGVYRGGNQAWAELSYTVFIKTKVNRMKSSNWTGSRRTWRAITLTSGSVDLLTGSFIAGPMLAS